MDRWKDYGRGLKTTFSVSTVGLEMALCVAVGYLVGDWLDSRFETRPYLMILFVVLGSAAGFLSLLSALKRLSARKDE